MWNKKYLLNDSVIAAARTHNQRVRFLEEEIKDAFWILLVTCPECGCINSLWVEEPIDPEGHHTCYKCWLKTSQEEYPDLFF